MFELLIASAVFAAPKDGQTHKECVETISSALEASGEPATAIAQATIFACIPAEAKPTSSSILGQMTTEDRNDILEYYRTVTERRVVLKIVRLRACRKTPGCSVAALPQVFERISEN